VVINKLVLLPYVDFDMDRFLHHLDAVHPGVETIRCSARTGEGVEEFREWLERVPARAPA
jgi:hydrogenase nickel incorporation protein HypB